jgi:CheY-like chemotaxis protein
MAHCPALEDLPLPGGADSVFISLRHEEARKEAETLKEALTLRGVSVFMKESEEIAVNDVKLMEKISNKLSGCQLAIVMGTSGYGEHKQMPMSTFDELQYIKCHKADYSCYFIKMCERFNEPVKRRGKAHRRHLSSTAMMLQTNNNEYSRATTWFPGEVMPVGLIKDVLERLKHASEMAESQSLPTIPEVVGNPQDTKEETAKGALQEETVSESNSGEQVEEQPPLKSQGVKPAGSMLTTTILSVDDDPMQQMLVKQLFVSLDKTYNVEIAMSGEEALQKLQVGATPDLILLDYSMSPSMSGMQVARKLRETYPKYNLPIVMVSATEDVNTIVECLASGECWCAGQCEDVLTIYYSLQVVTTSSRSLSTWTIFAHAWPRSSLSSAPTNAMCSSGSRRGYAVSSTGTRRRRGRIPTAFFKPVASAA